MKKLTTILTIAGSDSSGGAGIQADIKTATVNGVYASSVITAVTSQSSGGVSKIHPIPSSDIKTQLEAVFCDQKPDAIKIGMIGSIEALITISDFLKINADGIPIVADPVMVSTSGKILNGSIEEYSRAFLSTLSPLSTVVTPNIPEAKLFLKTNSLHVKACDDYSEISIKLLNLLGCNNIVLKGGHARGENVADYLAYKDSRNFIDTKVFIAKKIPSSNLHGTGCVYSTLMACALAIGKSITEAFLYASEEINSYIRKSAAYVFGDFCNGPLNLASYSLKQL